MFDFKSLLIVVSLFMLSGCQKVYETQYDFIAPESSIGAKCLKQCSRVKAMCEQNCSHNGDHCLLQVKSRANKAFLAYSAQRTEKGLAITKDLNSFYNPLQCNQDLCQCESDYRACYELCGGETIEKQVCIKNCD